MTPLIDICSQLPASLPATQGQSCEFHPSGAAALLTSVLLDVCGRKASPLTALTLEGSCTTRSNLRLAIVHR